MRFWQKVFLITLALLTLSMDVVASLMITATHNDNLEREIGNALREHEMLAMNVQTGLVYRRFDKQARFLSDEDAIAVMEGVASRVSGADSDGILLEVYRGSAALFSNLGFEVEGFREEIGVSGAQCDVVLRRSGGSHWMFIASLKLIENDYCAFITVHNMDDMFAARQDMIANFVRSGSIVSALVAVVLLGISYTLTRRLRALQDFSARFASGQYDQRTPVKGRDELAELAEDFNAMAEAVQQNLKGLESVADDRKKFIDNLAHEMKTPLTSIIGFADLLRSSRVVSEATRVDYANAIYSEGQHLKAVSGKLMELILLGRTRTDIETVELDEYLLEIATLMEPNLQIRRLQLFVESIRCPIELDRELMKSCLFNLIDNAGKASAPGQNMRLVGGRNGRGHLYIEVADHGSGMPKEEIRKVVQPFYMLDKARTRAAGGAGLGLALCVEIARVHGARLSISSQLGVGTSVRITFSEAIGA